MIHKKAKNVIPPVRKRKTTVSKWHMQADSEYFKTLKEGNTYEYNNKHYLDEESWGDYLSFRQGSWEDIL